MTEANVYELLNIIKLWDFYQSFLIVNVYLVCTVLASTIRIMIFKICATSIIIRWQQWQVINRQLTSNDNATSKKTWQILLSIANFEHQGD